MCPYSGFLGSLAVGLQKFSFRAMTGILICFFGIIFIFWDGLKRSGQSKLQEWYFLMFCAISGWASGTIFTKNEYTKRQYLIELILSICFCRNCTDYTGLYIFRQLQFWKLDLKKYIGYDLSCCFGSVTAFSLFTMHSPKSHQYRFPYWLISILLLLYF